MPLDGTAVIDEALTVLGGTINNGINSLIQAGSDDIQKDIVKAIEGSINEHIKRNIKDLKKLELAEKLYENILDRVFIEDDKKLEGLDIFKGVIAQRRESDLKQKNELERASQILNKCLEILSVYGCNPPKTDEPGFKFLGMGEGFTISSYETWEKEQQEEGETE